MIENIINKKRKQKTINLIYPALKAPPEIDHTYCSLPYLGKLTEKISRKIINKQVKVAYKPITNLSKLIFNNKDKTDELNKSGIYKLSCEQCNSVYIGQTGRNFNIRYKEHIRSFKNNKTDSNFSKHLIESKHILSKNHKPTILHTCSKSKKMSLLEALEINRINNDSSFNLLNDQLDLNHSPILNIKY